MAKETGLGFTVSVDDAAGAPQDISNDILSIDFGTPRNSKSSTGLDKSAMERLVLLADGVVTINGQFNTDTDMSHDVFKTVPSTSVVRTVTITLASGAVLAMEMLFTNYAISRPEDGDLTWSAPGVLADGSVPTWA